jgi:hypothetical protein
MQRKKISTDLIKALAVTTQLTNSVLEEDAARVMLADLSVYPEPKVLEALARCRRELKPGWFCLAEVIKRISDGHPGPEEAWSIAYRSADESDTVVLSQVMQAALAAVRPLMADGDMVAARMAFKEAYTESLEYARLHRIEPEWFVSLGTDPTKRAAALVEAEAAGRITQAKRLELSPPDQLEDARAIAGQPRLSYSGSGKSVAEHVASIKRRLEIPVADETSSPTQHADTAALKAESQRRVSEYLQGEQS